MTAPSTYRTPVDPRFEETSIAEPRHVAAKKPASVPALAISLGFALALVAGCASAAADGKTAARRGGTLVVGQYQEPTPYDPNRQYSWETYRVDKHIYESLVAEDLSKPASSGAPPIVPALAESWKVSPDAKTFTFTLRKGVKFHDGTDFNAEAVRFNVRRYTDPSFEFYDGRSNANMKPVYGALKEFKVIDDNTVQYTFNVPFLDFLRLLPQGNYVSGIYSPAALKKYGQDGLAEHPVGTGPFKFVERVRNEKTELARNDLYWGTKPYVDRVIFRPIQDDATRLAALRSGEIDILTRVPVDAVEGLKKSGFTVHNSPTAGQLFLGWNFKNEFGKEKVIRQAFIKAIDREGLTRTLFKSQAIPSYSILNASNTAYDTAQKDQTYDPEGARRLLEAAGYKKGAIKFTVVTDVANQATLEWVQRDLAKVGIEVNVVSQEWLTYTSKLANLAPETGLFTMEWGFITPYWLKIAHQVYLVNRGGGEKIIDQQLAPAIEKATAQTTEPKAIEEWKKANAIAQRDASFVPLLSFTNHFVSSKKVHGFNVPAQNFYDLSTVWLEK